MASLSLFSPLLQTLNSEYVPPKLPVNGFEPGSSGIGSVRAVNYAKPLSRKIYCYKMQREQDLRIKLISVR